MHVEVDVKCMQTNFGGYGTSPVSEIMGSLLACLQKRPKFPFRPWTIVHGGQKIELAQKFMQVEVDLKRMQTNFGGCGLFSFGDYGSPFLAFKNGQNFPSDHGL